MNNLYGRPMCDYLSYGGFKWLKMLMGLMYVQSAKRVQLDIFSRLILNILMNYMHSVMIIH